MASGCSGFLLTPKRVEMVGRETAVGVGPGRLGGESMIDYQIECEKEGWSPPSSHVLGHLYVTN